MPPQPPSFLLSGLLLHVIIDMKRVQSLLFLGGLLAWQTGLASEAEELLGRMQTAVTGLNYSGQLVYSRDNELMTYQIEHQAGQGGASESIVLLNRDGDSDADQPESFSLVNFNRLHLPDHQAYAIDMGGRATVAGHTCKVVVVRPKDKLRYLHRYCIEPDTGMLLRYSLMDRQQKQLEQMMFTQLDIQPKTAMPAAVARLASAARAASRLGEPEPALALMGSSGQRITDTGPEESAPSALAPVLRGWQFSSLPTGFRVIKVVPEPDHAGTYQVVLHDGMVSVSVFIAPTDPADGMEALSYNDGATNVLSTELDGYNVTLLGEVPFSTLQSIQKGLRYDGQ